MACRECKFLTVHITTQKEQKYSCGQYKKEHRVRAYVTSGHDEGVLYIGSVVIDKVQDERDSDGNLIKQGYDVEWWDVYYLKPGAEGHTVTVHASCGRTFSNAIGGSKPKGCDCDDPSGSEECCELDGWGDYVFYTCISKCEDIAGGNPCLCIYNDSILGSYVGGCCYKGPFNSSDRSNPDVSVEIEAYVSEESDSYTIDIPKEDDNGDERSHSRAASAGATISVGEDYSVSITGK